MQPTPEPARPPLPAPRRQSIAMGLLLLPLRVGLGGLFIFAAYAKWINPQKFVFAVKGFKILPDHLAVLATYAIPWTEIIAGVLLVLGLWSRAAATTIALLLLGFIAGIISVLARGISVECTCFGGFEMVCPKAVGPCNIAQNLVLLAVAVLIAVKGGGLLAADRGERDLIRA